MDVRSCEPRQPQCSVFFTTVRIGFRGCGAAGPNAISSVQDSAAHIARQVQSGKTCILAALCRQSPIDKWCWLFERQ